MIRKDSYSRRCNSCFFPSGGHLEFFPLPILHKKIIYLDQFLISNMMKYLNPKSKSHEKAKENQFWGELFENIDSLCKMQLIICPDSNFHKFESLLTPFSQQLKRIYELFSHGTSFYNYEDIKLFQISDQFNKWLGIPNRSASDCHKMIHGEINAWQERFIISMPDFDSQPLIDELRDNREIAHSQLEEVFKRWKSEPKKSFDDWFNEERKAEARVLIHLHYQDLQNYSKSIFGTEPIEAGFLIPSFATRLIMSMKNKIIEKGINNEAEIDKMITDFLTSGTFEDTPYIKIGSALFAAMAHRAAHIGKNAPPGKGFYNDVKMLSSLLPYCDAMFIDNECRSLLQDKDVQRVLGFTAKIFSLSNKDSFIEYLDQIRKSASKEHLKAVEEVYGKEGSKPYNEIFL